MASLNPVAVLLTQHAIELRSKGDAYRAAYAVAMDAAAAEIDRLEKEIERHKEWQRRKLSPCIETEGPDE